MKENLYHKYHSSREDERLGLFEELSKKYEINKVLYPGCFVHIAPSFFFTDVTYVDSMKSAETFFYSNNKEKIVKDNKEYKEEPKIKFIKSDYNKIKEKKESYDLLISQYAGFISQACKQFLKIEGILVTNNSHGDATMAHLDKDYELIAVYNRVNDEKYRITDKDLENYFIPKRKDITKNELLKKQSGIGYTKTPSGYIFKRIS